METKSSQEIFDTVVNHLRKQKVPSFKRNECCMYRGPGGTKCAVGCLIPDKLYSEDMEDKSIYTLLESPQLLSPKLYETFNAHCALINDLQSIHDMNVLDSHYLKQLEIGFKRCAKKFKLKYTPPK